VQKTRPPVGASLLAKNPQAPQTIWFDALSFTTIASKLAPTERVFLSACPLLHPDWNNDDEMAGGLALRTNPITAGQQLHVQSGGDASWTTLSSSLPMPLQRITRST
jgi:hypothetical protein